MQFRFKHLVFIGISALTLLGIGSVSGMHQSNVHADDWNTQAKEALAWGNSSKDPAKRFDEKDKTSQDKSLAKTYKTYTYDANFYKHEPKLTNQNQYNTKYWKAVDKREHEHKHSLRNTVEFVRILSELDVLNELNKINGLNVAVEQLSGIIVKPLVSV